MFASTAVSTSAQTIRLDFDETDLTEALTRYTMLTGVDIVYSTRLTQGLTTSCRYRGLSRRDALICIMSGHPFRSESLSRTQTVLIPIEGPDGSNGSQSTRVLTGFVVDAQTRESLIGAHVMLPGVGMGTVTNEAGFFAFAGMSDRPVSLSITYLGYSRLDTTLVAQPEAGSFSLQPTLYSVSGIVVEEESQRRAELTLSPGLVSMSGRELQRLPGSLGNTDVLESLRWMPGVQRAGEATGGLLIRGSGPDQNLYLIDGAPVYHPWHAFSLVSTFQSDTFKEVTLHRGGFPAEYGGRMSAVLDAELRDGSRAEPGVTVGITGLNAGFVMESPVSNKSSFMLSGRRSYVDRLIGRQHPVEDDSGRRDTLRTGYYYYDWSAKYTFRPDSRSSISLSYYTGRDNLDLRLPFDLSLDFSSWLRPADLFFEVDQSWGNRIISARFQRLVSSRLFVTGTLYQSGYDARENTFVRPSQSSAVRSRYGVDLEDTGARIVVDYYPGVNHQLRFGGEIVRHRFDSDLDALITYSPTLSEPLSESDQTSTTEGALFIQDTWSPGPTLKLLPSFRVSSFGRGSFLRAEPRMALQWAIDPNWMILRMSAGSHIQYMHRIRDRNAYLYDLVSARWVPSSPDAAPARSRQISIGLESHRIPRTRVRLDGFVRDGSGILLPEDEFQTKDGLLGPGIEVATLLGQYDVGEERSRGVEAEVETRFGPWYGLLAYTRMRSENRVLSEFRDPFRPSRFDTPHNVALVISRETTSWHVGMSLDWRSGYPVSVPESRYALTDPVSNEVTWYYHRPVLNNGRLPAYVRMDVRAARQFRFAEANWSAGLHIYNVFNHRNVVSQSWDPARATATPRDRLGLPILPLLELVMTL